MRLCRPTSAAKASISSTAEPGDRARPCGRAVAKVRFERLRRVGVARHPVAVGKTVAEQRVHDRAGEGAVGPGLELERQIRLPQGLGRIDVDRDDLRAALLAGARRMGHQIDLGRGRVGPPDDDDVGLRHFRRRDPRHPPRARDIARPGDADADGAEEAGIALDVGQALEPVAHHEAHRAGIEIGPDAFGSVLALGLEECFGDAVERFVPGDRARTARSLSDRRAGAAGSAGPDDGCARRSAPLSRTRLPACRDGRPRHARARSGFRRSPRRRARRPTGSRAGRRRGGARYRAGRSCGTPEPEIGEAGAVAQAADAPFRNRL